MKTVPTSRIRKLENGSRRSSESGLVWSAGGAVGRGRVRGGVTASEIDERARGLADQGLKNLSQRRRGRAICG